MLGLPPACLGPRLIVPARLPLARLSPVRLPLARLRPARLPHSPTGLPPLPPDPLPPSPPSFPPHPPARSPFRRRRHSTRLPPTRLPPLPPPTRLSSFPPARLPPTRLLDRVSVTWPLASWRKLFGAYAPVSFFFIISPASSANHANNRPRGLPWPSLPTWRRVAVLGPTPPAYPGRSPLLPLVQLGPVEGGNPDEVQPLLSRR